MRHFILLTIFALSAQLAHAGSTPIQQVEAKVTRYVGSYYKSHSVEGRPDPSGYIIVDVDLGKTEAVDGWTGRYLTTGRATVQMIDVGPNYTVQFEAVSEFDAKGVLAVLSVKSVKVEGSAG